MLISATLSDQIMRIAELERAEERYNKVRSMSPAQFTMLYKENLNGSQSFDELVDHLPGATDNSVPH